MNDKKQELQICILDFDDIANPLLGAGQAKSTYEVGSRLVRKGHKVTVLCSRYPGYRDRIENGISYVHIGIGTKYLKLNNFFYFPASLLAVRKINKGIILECFTAPISTLMSPLFSKVPVIAKPTSFEAERFAKKYHLPFQLFEKLGIRLYRYFMPYSSESAEKFRKYNKNAYFWEIAEGVDDECFKIEKKEPKHVLCLGRIDISQKGLDLLLDAYEQAYEKIGLDLVIAGSGPDLRKMSRLIKKKGLAERVKLAGPAYGKKKSRLLGESLLVVIPSRHEGFCIFGLEALASGLPLIIFDVPGLSWIPETSALRAKPFETQDFAKKMIYAVQNREQMEKMGSAGREFARDFSWDNIALSYEDFFYKILEMEKTHGHKR